MHSETFYICFSRREFLEREKNPTSLHRKTRVFGTRERGVTKQACCCGAGTIGFGLAEGSLLLRKVHRSAGGRPPSWMPRGRTRARRRQSEASKAGSEPSLLTRTYQTVCNPFRCSVFGRLVTKWSHGSGLSSAPSKGLEVEGICGRRGCRRRGRTLIDGLLLPSVHCYYRKDKRRSTVQALRNSSAPDPAGLQPGTFSNGEEPRRHCARQKRAWPKKFREQFSRRVCRLSEVRYAGF